MTRRATPLRRRGHHRWSSIVLAVVVVAGSGVARAGEAPPPNPASDRGVAPQVLSTGSSGPVRECASLTGRDDVVAFRVPGEAEGFPDASPYDDGTRVITITAWDPASKSFSWSSDLPFVGVWVKGGIGGGGNWYDYTAFRDAPPDAGADHDAGLHTQPNPNGPAGLSHVTFCSIAAPAAVPDLVVDTTDDAGGVLRPGDRVSYRIAIENVGDGLAHRVQVVHELPAGFRVLTLVPDLDGGPCTVASSVGPGGRFSMSVTCRRPTLEAGASSDVGFVAQVTHDAPCGEVRSVTTVSAGDEPDDAVDGRNRTVLADDVACPASIVLGVSGPASAHEGDEVTIRAVVTNDGEADLHDVTMRLAGCSAPARTDGGNGDDVLVPRESWSYGCSGVVGRGKDDPVRVDADVSATDGEVIVSRTATHRIDVLHPEIRLRTTATPASGQVGDSVTFAYAVNNTGDAPVSGVVVIDDVTGRIGTVNRLAPGETATLTRDYVLGSSDVRVVRVGTVTGVDELGRQVRDSDATVLTVVAAEDEGADGVDGGTAFTGSDVTRPAGTAAVLLLLGLGALAVTRRRRGIL